MYDLELVQNMHTTGLYSDSEYIEILEKIVFEKRNLSVYYQESLENENADLLNKVEELESEIECLERDIGEHLYKINYLQGEIFELRKMICLYE